MAECIFYLRSHKADRYVKCFGTHKKRDGFVEIALLSPKLFVSYNHKLVFSDCLQLDLPMSEIKHTGINTCSVSVRTFSSVERRDMVRKRIGVEVCSSTFHFDALLHQHEYIIAGRCSMQQYNYLSYRMPSSRPNWTFLF